MNTAHPAFRSAPFPVGRYTCVLVAVRGPDGNVTGLRGEWEPETPRHRLDAVDLAQYRVARDAFLHDVARRTGQRVLVVDA